MGVAKRAGLSSAVGEESRQPPSKLCGGFGLALLFKTVNNSGSTPALDVIKAF